MTPLERRNQVVNSRARARFARAPLTSYPGWQCCPSLSRDGNEVAFTWTRPKQDNSDIYVKLVGTENAVRLTADPALDSVPLGRQMAG